jgi:hypothetical protein
MPVTAATFRALVLAYRGGAKAGAAEAAKWPGPNEPGLEARAFMEAIDRLIARDASEREAEQRAEKWTALLRGERTAA